MERRAGRGGARQAAAATSHALVTRSAAIAAAAALAFSSARGAPARCSPATSPRSSGCSPRRQQARPARRRRRGVELAEAVLAVLALDRGARAGRRPGAARRARWRRPRPAQRRQAVGPEERGLVAAGGRELDGGGDLDPARPGAVDGSPIAAAAAVAFSSARGAPPGARAARRGSGDLDQLGGAGAAVELADAVLAVLALDRGARARRRPGGAAGWAAALATSSRRSTAGLGSPSWRWRTGRQDLGDQLGPELVAVAGDVPQARTSTPSTGGTVARPRSSNRTGVTSSLAMAGAAEALEPHRSVRRRRPRPARVAIAAAVHVERMSKENPGLDFTRADAVHSLLTRARSRRRWPGQSGNRHRIGALCQPDSGA